MTQTKYGAATSNLREPDAVDAMELGARRMDFIGLKFQLADEMSAGYARALAASTSLTVRPAPASAASLSDLNGVNGRIQDLRNGYTLTARTSTSPHGFAPTGPTGCTTSWNSTTTPRRFG